MANETKLDGTWPIERRRFSSEAFIHAIGQTNVAYNALEEMITLLGCYLFKADTFDQLLRSLNNRKRIDLIRGFTREFVIDEEPRAALMHCMDCYEMCVENRNILAHIVTRQIDDKTDTTELIKRASSNPMREITFSQKTEDVRAIADNTLDTFDYAFGIMLYLKGRAYPKIPFSEYSQWEIEEGGWPPPLPDRPPVPRRLIPLPPEERSQGE